MMKNHIPVITFTLALLIAAMAAPQVRAEVQSTADRQSPADKVMLQESVTVNSRRIRLGDIFINTGDKASAVIAYAPEPGKKAIFDARWLYRVARIYRLDWKPESVADRSVVIRQSVVIDRAEIEDQILAALANKDLGDNISVELNNRMMRLYVPGDASATIAVEDVIYEPRTQRFSAIIVAPAGSPEAKRIRVSGRARSVSDVPVLSRRILAGEVITADDIKWIKAYSRRLQANTIIDAADLVGKTPRRIIRQGAIIKASDVRRPIMVAKGSLVTIILSRPRMTLTSQGKAMEAGSDGDTIRVSNTRSNIMIEAIVIGYNKVTVVPASQMAMR